MSDKKNLGHNSKKDFLKKPVEHIDITSFDSRKIISSMEKMSFVSRETANAANIFNEMIKDKECTIFLTLAGSTSAGNNETPANNADPDRGVAGQGGITDQSGTDGKFIIT